jgi:phospholipase A-2-activating protein
VALTTEDEKNLSEVYALLSLPAGAQPDPDAAGKERYDPSALLALIERWPEAQRFPRESSPAIPQLPLTGEQYSISPDASQQSPRPSLLSPLLLC